MLLTSIFFIFFLVFSQSVFAENTASTKQFGTCQQLQTHATELQLNSIDFFSTEKSPIFISICRDTDLKVFEQFFAYLHTSKKASNIVPKAGLNRIKAVIKPDHKVFATGVVALQQESLQRETLQRETLQQESQTYQVRMRVRINDGDFTDLVVDMVGREGQMITVEHKGFSITLAKPSKAK